MPRVFKSSLLAVLVLTLVVALPAAARDADPGERVAAPNADRAMLALEAEVPGFGGLWIGDDGVVHAFVRDPASAPVEHLERLVGQSVRVERGDFAFSQLSTWRDRGRGVLNAPGVVLIDADERLNRVRVGIVPGEGAARRARAVRALLAARGVPAEAVEIEEVPEVHRVVTLSDAFNPVPGGVEINFSNFLCTLGFNIRFADEGACFFMTNDHCTDAEGTVTGTVYFQPFGGPQIGVEVADPPFFTGAPCPVGRECRFSDAAAARYDDPADCEFASIARTLLNSTTINNAQPRWTIVSKQLAPTVGQRMGKVGRTTGWTVGDVVATCVDSNVAGTNNTMLCQSFVSAGVGSGDSGSPVFRFREDSSLAQLSGILWGSSGGSLFVYSPMENIEIDFGLSIPVF